MVLHAWATMLMVVFAHAATLLRKDASAHLVIADSDGRRGRGAPSPDAFESVLAQLNKVVHATEGNTDDHEVEKQQQFYIGLARTLRANQTFCETGFNGGHSALVFLAYSQATVYEFDLGQHDYGKIAEQFLQRQYPGRLHVTWGDSTQTLLKFHERLPKVMCDILIVDGGHQNEVAKADLTNFAHMAAPGHVLVVDDTPCHAEYCEGPNLQWSRFEKAGCLETTKRVSLSNARGFTFGRYLPCPLWNTR